MNIRSFINNHKAILVGLLLVVLVQIIGSSSYLIEQFYLPYFYTPYSKLLRFIFGWLPFSIGDVLYYLAICWVLYAFFYLVKKIWQKHFTKKIAFALVKKMLTFALYLYAFFYLAWGLHYNRKSIATTLNITTTTYNKTDLQHMLTELVSKINTLADSVPKEENFNFSNIKPFAVKAYSNVAVQYPYLQYTNTSIKKSMFSLAANYLGFQGYYNPFTGEAQVNTYLPNFMIPNIMVHEMAHQIGYAFEDEASFVGYLAMLKSDNNYLKYSVYFDMFLFASAELYNRDYKAVDTFVKQLQPIAKKHLVQFQTYNKQYNTPLADASNWVYNSYLHANNMLNGINTYNQVIALVMAYNRKNNNP